MRFASSYFIPQDILDSYGASVTSGIRVLLAIIILFIVVFAVPAGWRRNSAPQSLRLITYCGVQGIAVALGLLMLGYGWWGAIIAWVVGGIGTVGWWAWQQRWKGSGIAPSPLTGVLRPPIVPGQVWYAFVHGHKENKIRPVMVLNWDAERSGWIVVYFTTQPPKSDRIASGYLTANVDQIRGLSQKNWVRVSDVRTLGRRAFRSYTGLAPSWLYEAACQRTGTVPSLDARTLDEEQAGRVLSPFELALLDALGVRDVETPGPDPKIAASFLSRLFRRDV